MNLKFVWSVQSNITKHTSIGHGIKGDDFGIKEGGYCAGFLGLYNLKNVLMHTLHIISVCLVPVVPKRLDCCKWQSNVIGRIHLF
ncbi:MAG: hypothetical protein HKP31_09015 [Nitrosopumilus sp.]|nr:hypothetical protein [Nitrosopumilus sp.]